MNNENFLIEKLDIIQNTILERLKSIEPNKDYQYPILENIIFQFYIEEYEPIETPTIHIEFKKEIIHNEYKYFKLSFEKRFKKNYIEKDYRVWVFKSRPLNNHDPLELITNDCDVYRLEKNLSFLKKILFNGLSNFEKFLNKNSFNLDEVITYLEIALLVIL